MADEFIAIDAFSARELARIRRKVDSINGPGVTNRPDSISIAPVVATQRPSPAQQAREVVLVKITGNASGGGKYTGRVLTKPTSDVSASGNLALADVGEVPDEDDALILNLQELGKATHDLTASPVTVTCFLGVRRSVNSDGTVVVAINGNDLEDCT